MNPSSIETRLRRLERMNQAMALALAGMLSAGVLGAVHPAKEEDADILTASAVHIVDAEGRIVAELGPGEEGAGLYVRDAEGRNRISLAHGPEQTGLFVLDAAGDRRVGAVHFAHGGSGFALHGEGVKGAAVLYYKGGGSLTFYDTEGGVTGRFPDKRPVPEPESGERK